MNISQFKNYLLRRKDKDKTNHNLCKKYLYKTTYRHIAFEYECST